MTRSAADVRCQFLEFFRQRGHAIVPGSPVIPYDDPTLLFTNAGMNQFKPYFLGTATPRHRRVADTQPCIRAGGKHNDLDDVGHDTYHHTFFEMLGNWSFGDYFKKEAIAWAWELLTRVWGLDRDRLHATYFGGSAGPGKQRTAGSAGAPHAVELEPDLEARDLWATVTDIDPSHIHPGAMKDNFWEMGDTGPCGPCSEIHIDLTPDKSGGRLVNAGDPRVIEIWNLVFIQFNRDAGGRLTPLPARHVDTGMGFERVCALLQGKSSNYDTDIFTPIFQAIRDVTGAPPYRGTLPARTRGQQGEPQVMIDVAYRVIADHIRCLTFALNDGCLPDREGRGYVLRRILRRAVRYGWQYLDVHEPFLHRLVPAVVDTLADAFPQLKGEAGASAAGSSPALGPQRVAEIIREEEESFDRTLERGIALFDEAADRARRRHHGVLRGEDAFRLHDTYGFPIDLTEIMARERGLTVDIGAYERLMEEARERARAGTLASGGEDVLADPRIRERLRAFKSPFVGYETLETRCFVTEIIRLDKGAVFSSELQEGQRAAVVIDPTPFYAEKGGQVGDRGEIIARSAERIVGRFAVEDTREIDGVVLHFGRCVSGRLLTGPAAQATCGELQESTAEESLGSEFATARVDASRRGPTMQNHTATHLMNWALREVLGDHVQQKGSLVDPDRTRFDFSHPRALSPEEIQRVEQLVNQRIAQNLPVDWDDQVPLDVALRINGVRAVFGEKYPDPVRVVCCGVSVEELRKAPASPEWRKYPVELCGGTHVKSTGDIGHFAIVSEEAVAKGIRRVVAVTGEKARAVIDRGAELLGKAEQLRRLGTPHHDRSETGPTDNLPSQVAELQQAVNAATLRVVDRVRLRNTLSQLQQMLRQQQKQEAAAARDVLAEKVAALIRSAPQIGDTTVVVSQMPELPIDRLKTAADMIKQKCRSAAVLFGLVQEAPPEQTGDRAGAAEAQASGTAILLAAMSNDLVQRGIRAGDLIRHVAPLVDGRGGGPPTMAQGGGRDPARLSDALEAGRNWILQALGR